MAPTTAAISQAKPPQNIPEIKKGMVITMPGKYQRIVELAAEKAKAITSEPALYPDFLKTAANNYKYTFTEQLLIYAQKADATACTDIENWNRLGRWVNRGTKGIALIVNSNSPYKLRYVFDISDTNSRYGHEIKVWRMSEGYEDAVIEALRDTYGEIENADSLATALLETADTVVRDNMTDYLALLNRNKGGSLLEEIDELNTEVKFRELLKNGVAYMLLSRCGCAVEPYFESEDFREIINFNTPDTLNILGSATSEISEVILREIESTVRSAEREDSKRNRTFANAGKKEHNTGVNETTERRNKFENLVFKLGEFCAFAANDGGNFASETDTKHPGKQERDEENNGTDLHEAGGLSDTQSDTAGEPENRQVRNDERNILTGTQENRIQFNDAVGQAEQPFGGSGQTGNRDDGEAHQTDGTERAGNREAQSDRPNEMGWDDELDKESGGGNRFEPIDSELKAKLPDCKEEVIFQALRHGDYLAQSKESIVSFLLSEPDERKKTDFVRSMYKDGLFAEMFKPDSTEHIGYRATESGLTVYEGNYLTRTAESGFSWDIVRNLIEYLIDNNDYLDTPAVKEKVSLQPCGHNFNDRSEIDYYYSPSEKNELIRNCPHLKEHRKEIADFFAKNGDYNEREFYNSERQQLSEIAQQRSLVSSPSL